MLRVPLPYGCNQGVPPPPEICICSTFAQVCNPVGIVATITEIFKSKLNSKNMKKLSGG